MSRTEIYPWAMLTEVGDYFAVPTSFKPYSYMSMLVAQRNYKTVSGQKLTTHKTTYGTIVMLAQVRDELPPYEFLSAEGIMSITDKRYLMKLAREPHDPTGEKPTRPVRTVSQMVNVMTLEAKQANLPWWYEKGKLVFNPRVATKEDLDAWVSKQKTFNKDAPYPDYYHLDEDLTRKSSVAVAAEESEPSDEDEYFEVLQDQPDALEEAENDDAS